MSAPGRLAEQDRDLAEEVAAGQGGSLLAVDQDLRLAVEDHVEGRAGQALAEDAGALGEDLLLEDVGDPLELRRRQVGEQREAGDLIDDLVAGGHRTVPPSEGQDRRILTPLRVERRDRP